MRIIDADALKEKSYWECYSDPDDDYEYVLVTDIDREPTIDAVPVVRCKDCKYKVTTRDGEWNPEDVVCTYWATDGLCAEDYCSQGKEGQYEFD